MKKMPRSKYSVDPQGRPSTTDVSTVEILARVSNPWFQLIATLHDEILRGSYEFFGNLGLRTVPLPFAASSVASPIGLGSDSLPLPMQIGGRQLYLPDSMQFGLEYGCRLFEHGCFCVFPSFRGDDLDRRHLRHYYHAEAEIRGEFEDAVKLAEEYIRFLTSRLSTYSLQIEKFAGNVEHIELLRDSSEIPRITLDDACRLIPKKYVQTDEKLGFRMLTDDGEQLLLEKMKSPVWLIDLDHLAVPFYQAFADVNVKTAKAADLLMGLGEVVGLGERHPNIESVKAAMKLHKLPATGYRWYLNMKKQFPLRTSGFGVGIERYLCWLLRRNNVWDCQLLPKLRDGVGFP